MSWAALVSKDKGKAVDFGSPHQTVYARDTTIDETERRLHNVDHETVSGITLPSFTKGLLILDANAIIKRMDNFNSIADAFVTTSQVIAEIRDTASKEVLERLPHQLVVLDPSPECVQAVIDCAEKTGDLGVLSRTDIRLCALALGCCRAGHCLGDPIDPRPASISHAGSVNIVEEAVSPEEDPNCEDDGDREEEGPQGADEDGSEGEWITSENIQIIEERDRTTGTTFDGGMACVTSDFAMQNTLLHLGVPIVGTSGMRISELRLWLLRCTGCFHVIMDTTRQFCPACGSGDTLRRVNYVVNSNGERQLFINFKKHISTRGTIYNLPKPRGGKRGTNRSLVLREDQLAQVIRGTSGTQAKARQAMTTWNDEDLATFGEAPKHKKRNIGEPKSQSSYHKYNMNEKKKLRASHRK